MNRRVSIEARQVGRREPLIAGWSLDLDVAEPLTGAGLIEAIVVEEVGAYNRRERDRQLPRVLTRAEIDAGVAAGKIDPARHDEPRFADPAVAVETAIQGFRDGLYYLFVNNQQVEYLDEPVATPATLDVMFLRLVPLAGG